MTYPVLSLEEQEIKAKELSEELRETILAFQAATGRETFNGSQLFYSFVHQSVQMARAGCAKRFMLQLAKDIQSWFGISEEEWNKIMQDHGTSFTEDLELN